MKLLHKEDTAIEGLTQPRVDYYIKERPWTLIDPRWSRHFYFLLTDPNLFLLDLQYPSVTVRVSNNLRSNWLGPETVRGPVHHTPTLVRLRSVFYSRRLSPVTTSSPFYRLRTVTGITPTWVFTEEKDSRGTLVVDKVGSRQTKVCCLYVVSRLRVWLNGLP